MSKRKVAKWKARAKEAQAARLACAEVCNARRQLLDRVVGACLRYAPPADMLSVVENDYERWVGHVEVTLKSDEEHAKQEATRLRLVGLEAGALRGRLAEVAATLRSWKRENEPLSNAQLEALALRCLEPL